MHSAFSLLATSIAVALPTTGFSKAAVRPAPAHPERVLTCTVARLANIDKSRFQKSEELVREGRHRLVVRLAAAPVLQGAPPDPSDDPVPIDPRTGILEDPDGLTRDARQMARVADLWPQRVELLAPIPGTRWNQFVTLNPIDLAKGVAGIYLAPVKDAAQQDLTQVYQGVCTIALNPNTLTGGAKSL